MCYEWAFSGRENTRALFLINKNQQQIYTKLQNDYVYCSCYAVFRRELISLTASYYRHIFEITGILPGSDINIA